MNFYHCMSIMRPRNGGGWIKLTSEMVIWQREFEDVRRDIFHPSHTNDGKELGEKVVWNQSLFDVYNWCKHDHESVGRPGDKYRYYEMAQYLAGS